MKQETALALMRQRGTTVYHFVLDHRYGGPLAYVDGMVKALPSEFRAEIVTTGRGQRTTMSLTNLRHRWAPLYAIEVLLNAVRVVGWGVSGRIRRRGSVFEVHGAANIAPILAARVLGVPVVWRIHETVPAFRAFIRAGMLILRGHPHKLVSVARRAADVFKLRDSVVVRPAIDLAFWSRQNICKQGRPVDRPWRFAAVGNLNPLKGFDLLLQAVDRLTFPWELTIAGAQLDTHREYADSLALRAAKVCERRSDRTVTFAGACTASDVRVLLESCDVFVLPSRSEACPLALIEALAMGCLCVVSDVGDVADMVPAEFKCLVVQAEDVDALATALAGAVAFDSERLSEYRDHAVSDVHANYRYERLAAVTQQLYSSLGSHRT